MSQHTPGPWHVSVGLNAGYISSDTHGFVTIRNPFSEGAWSLDHKEAMANARLIAKAPEMLSILQALNRQGGVFEDWGEENVGGVDEDFDAVSAARALLREIEGEKT